MINGPNMIMPPMNNMPNQVPRMPLPPVPGPNMQPGLLGPAPEGFLPRPMGMPANGPFGGNPQMPPGNMMGNNLMVPPPHHQQGMDQDQHDPNHRRRSRWGELPNGENIERPYYDDMESDQYQVNERRHGADDLSPRDRDRRDPRSQERDRRSQDRCQDEGKPNLSKAQKLLYDRIASQQRDTPKDADKPKLNDSWYSSDEDESKKAGTSNHLKTLPRPRRNRQPVHSSTKEPPPAVLPKDLLLY